MQLTNNDDDKTSVQLVGEALKFHKPGNIKLLFILYFFTLIIHIFIFKVRTIKLKDTL